MDRAGSGLSLFGSLNLVGPADRLGERHLIGLLQRIIRIVQKDPARAR
jgi:hypothetical protein